MRFFSEDRIVVTALILLIASLLILSAPAEAAEPADPEYEMELLEEFLRADELEEDMYSQQLLDQIDIDQLLEVRDEFSRELGEIENIERTGDHLYEINYTKGRLDMQFAVFDDRVTSIYFLSATETGAELEDIVEDFAEFSGDVSLLVKIDGEEIISHEPEKELAVGSTFKLAVLSALEGEIEAGERSWSDTLTLSEQDRSLPTGELHNWPAGFSFTLESLAGRMISRSDNTATDMLINELGREKIEEISPHNRPFFTTREAFILKDPGRAEILERYRGADAEKKYDILQELEDEELPSADIFEEVRALDVEWFFSTRELAELMEEVGRLDLMTINPGPADPENWERIAFKGGSEPGVVNYTHLLKDENEGEYFISATWNDEEELPEGRFERFYSSLLEELSR